MLFHVLVSGKDSLAEKKNDVQKDYRDSKEIYTHICIDFCHPIFILLLIVVGFVFIAFS